MRAVIRTAVGVPVGGRCGYAVRMPSSSAASNADVRKPSTISNNANREFRLRRYRQIARPIKRNRENISRSARKISKHLNHQLSDSTASAPAAHHQSGIEHSALRLTPSWYGRAAHARHYQWRASKCWRRRGAFLSQNAARC